MVRPSTLLLALTLAAISAGPALAADDPPLPHSDCRWQPDFAAFVYEKSGGAVHLHDGDVCTVHAHPPA